METTLNKTDEQTYTITIQPNDPKKSSGGGNGGGGNFYGGGNGGGGNNRFQNYVLVYQEKQGAQPIYYKSHVDGLVLWVKYIDLATTFSTIESIYHFAMSIIPHMKREMESQMILNNEELPQNMDELIRKRMKVFKWILFKVCDVHNPNAPPDAQN